MYVCIYTPRDQEQTGKKKFNVYLSVGVLGELEHGLEVEAITFFPASDFGIT